MLKLTNCNTGSISEQIRVCKFSVALPREEHNREWHRVEGSEVVLEATERYIPLIFRYLTAPFTLIYQLEQPTKLHRYVWPSGAFSDVTLVAGGESFRVHRAILAMASEYFHALFTGYADADKRIIFIEETTSEELKCILDLIYCQPVPIGGLRALEVAAAAQKFSLQLPLMETVLRNLIKIRPEDSGRAVQLLEALYPVELDGIVVDSVFFESLEIEDMRRVFPTLPSQFRDLFDSIYGKEAIEPPRD